MGGCTIRSGVAVIVGAKRLSGKRGQNQIANQDQLTPACGAFCGAPGGIYAHTKV